MKGKSLIASTRNAWRRRRSRAARDGLVGSPSQENLKQIVITAEKTETFVIRQMAHQPLQVFCTHCNEEISCLTMEEAVKLTGMAARKIFMFVEAGKLHAYETEEGFLLLCPISIASFINL